MNILHVNKYPSTTCFLSEFDIIPKSENILGLLGGEKKNLDIAVVCEPVCLSKYILFLFLRKVLHYVWLICKMIELFYFFLSRIESF